jgi:Fic family protein
LVREDGGAGGQFYSAQPLQPAQTRAATGERLRKVVNQLLDGFEDKLTSSKWAKLAKCSQDTAHRDIVDLVKRGILAKDAAGGPSTSYSLTEPAGKTGPG